MEALQFSQQEQTVRKKWQILLIYFAISAALYHFLERLFFSEAMVALNLPENVLTTTHIAWSAVATTVLFYWFYRCAYKKPGTKLLTLYATTYVLSLLFSLPQYYSELSTLGSSSYKLFFCFKLAFIVLNTSLGIWHAFLSWQMRAINKKRQADLILHSSEFQQTKTLLEQATSLEELEKFLAQALQKRTKKFKNAVKDFYLQRKCALQSSLQNPAD